MSKIVGKTKTLIWVTLLLVVVVLGIGYAAISAVQLRIEGSASADAVQSNFNVEYERVDLNNVVANFGGGKITASVYPYTEDKAIATIDVSNMTARGNRLGGRFIVKNKSEDLSAKLSAKLISNSNEEYFKVTYSFDKNTIVADEETSILVVVELLKTPIEEEVTGTFEIELTAEPVQP